MESIRNEFFPQIFVDNLRGIKIRMILRVGIVSFFILSIGLLTAHASNIQVSSINITGRDVSAGANNPANFAFVRFSVSWSNSWRTSTAPFNWDAAWVFIKYKVGTQDITLTPCICNGGTTVTVPSTKSLAVGMPIERIGYVSNQPDSISIASIINDTTIVVTHPMVISGQSPLLFRREWRHAWLNNNGHTAPTGSTIDIGLLRPDTAFHPTLNPGLGAFIYRNANGTGANNFTNVLLRWNYGAQGVPDDSIVDIHVFAMEMVYVPGGVDFQVGLGTNNTYNYIATTINAANATIAPSGTGSIVGQAGGYPTSETPPTSPSWPNGYNAFYCMKYELSQGMFRDFLNHLTRLQQVTVVGLPLTMYYNYTGSYMIGYYFGGVTFQWGAVTGLNRIGIRLIDTTTLKKPLVFACDLSTSTTLPSDVNQSNDGEFIPVGFINWSRLCAILDWFGLRPMTSMEYEKACRGGGTLNTGYPWGNTDPTYANNITSGGLSNESSSTAGANCVSSNQLNVQGPLRCGVFAGASTTRVQSGASYYGIMELAGNLHESVVDLRYNNSSRAYTGLHGNGLISFRGLADVTGWPGLINGEVLSNGDYIWLRGGSFCTTGSFYHSISFFQQRGDVSNRYSDIGCRGVRSAP